MGIGVGIYLVKLHVNQEFVLDRTSHQSKHGDIEACQIILLYTCDVSVQVADRLDLNLRVIKLDLRDKVAFVSVTQVLIK